MRIKHSSIVITGLLTLLFSCNYTTVKDNSTAYQVPDAEVMVMESNQFQWLLQDYTIWNRAVYTTSEPMELYAKRLFAVTKLPFPPEAIKKFTIKDIVNKTSFSVEYKNNNKKLDHEPYYVLLGQDKKIIARFNKTFSDDALEFTITYKDSMLTMKSVPDNDINVTIVEIKDASGNITFMRKKMDFFSDRLEFDIRRENNPIEDIFFVAAGLVFDDTVKSLKGRYK